MYSVDVLAPFMSKASLSIFSLLLCTLIIDNEYVISDAKLPSS